MPGWKEPYTYIIDFLPLTASDGTSFQDVVIKTFKNRKFEMIRSIHRATDGRINLRITNNSTGHDVIRQQGDVRAVSSTAISGITANSFLPYNYPIPYVIPAASEILFSASDKSGASNNFRLAIHGNKIYDGDAPYKNRLHRERFSFTIDSGSIPAYGTSTIPFTFAETHGFLAAKLTGVSTGEGLIFIQDVAPWMSKDCHFYNMVGNAQFGNNLTSRKWIPEKSTVTVKFTDLSGSTNRMRVTFHGEKVFIS